MMQPPGPVYSLPYALTKIEGPSYINCWVDEQAYQIVVKDPVGRETRYPIV